MKRFVSVDFMRGLAILLMILLHIFIEIFDTDVFLDAVQEGKGNIGFIVFAVVIVFFASFAGFFIMISGFSNFISMQKTYDKLVSQNVPNAHKVVRRIQITRGLITIFMGYLIWAVIYPYILEPLVRLTEGESWQVITMDINYKDFIGELFWFSIIRFLGLATIVVAIVYTAMLKRNLSPKAKLRTLWIVVLVLYVVTPFVLYGIRSIDGYWPGPWRGWEERSLGSNILFVFLGLFAGKEQPLFPWIIASFLGTIIGIEVHYGGITRKFRIRWVKRGLIMLFSGIILQVVFALISANMEGRAQELFEAGFGYIFGAQDRSTSYMLFVGGAEVMIFTSFMRAVEGKGRAERFAKHTIIIRRAGMIALSIYGLQALSLFPVILMERGYGLIPLERQSNLLQMFTILLICMELWILFIWSWEKINFFGSFEWLAATLLSIGHKGKKIRLNSKEVLYNVEPMTGGPEENVSAEPPK